MTAIEFSNEELRKLQLIEFDLLVELDRVCKENNIKYNISAGTMLGAVRHKGFIPWDDDIDVNMLREEYEKFKKVADQLNPEICFLQDHQTDPYYRWGYSKVRRVGTSYVRSGQEHMKYKDGVFIDVFVLDDVPEGYLSARIQNFLSFCARKLTYAELGKTQEKGFFKCWYSILSKISVDFAFKLINVYKKRSRNDSKSSRVRSLFWPEDFKIDAYSDGKKAMGWLKEWHLELEEYEFEGLKFPGPKNYDGYLTRRYGADYMTPLPPEERGQHSPVSSCDFGNAKAIYYKGENNPFKVD